MGEEVKRRSMVLKDGEPKEGGGYARYEWRKGCFMLCVEPTTMNSVTSLRSYQETHLSVTEVDDVPGSHFDNTLTLCIYPMAMRGFAMGTRAAHRARHRRVDGRVRQTITRLRLGLGNTRFYPSHDGRNGCQTGHRQIL